jgi:hypothetical protein
MRNMGGAIRPRATVILLGLFLVAALRPAYGQAVPPSQQSGPTPDTESAPNQPQPSLTTPLPQKTIQESYHPITARQRLRWVITNTIGPSHLIGGLFTAGMGTALDRPREDGPHWGGFAERYGIRLTGIVPGNIMEASVGALWGEDPRYFRAPQDHFGGRVRNIVKQTFLARQRDGCFAPAYARYVAVTGNNFLSNEWRPDSEANNHDAVLRSLEGIAGRMASNAFEEFWPDVKTHVFHKSE